MSGCAIRCIWPIGRDRDDVEFVDLVELFRLGHRRTRHTADFVIQFEIVLQRDGRQRLRLFLDLDAFFGFHRLVQAIAPLTTFHQSSGELVDDHNSRRL